MRACQLAGMLVLGVKTKIIDLGLDTMKSWPCDCGLGLMSLALTSLY